MRKPRAYWVVSSESQTGQLALRLLGHTFSALTVARDGLGAGTYMDNMVYSNYNKETSTIDYDITFHQKEGGSSSQVQS